ncbi:hypothetical protein P8452_14746 [Trifolium repens]|nr:hypothetical protein P8452_14746 [Trifolium repens]
MTNVSVFAPSCLRNVDQRSYTTYQELSSDLEKRSTAFPSQCGSHGALGREMLSESKLRDLLLGSEYIFSPMILKMEIGCL